MHENASLVIVTSSSANSDSGISRRLSNRSFNCMLLLALNSDNDIVVDEDDEDDENDEGEPISSPG